MTNFDTAREALETSLNSSGSAMAEHEKWMQSIEASVNKVKAAWQSLSQSFLKSSFLKGLLNTVSAIADGASKLFDTLGTLPSLATLFMGGMSLFNKGGFFKVATDELTGFATGITTTFGQVAKSVNASLSSINLNKGFAQTLNQTDIAAIQNYSNAVSNAAKTGVTDISTLNKCMVDASDVAKTYVQNTDAAAVSVDGFVKQQQAAEVSTLAQNKSLGSARVLMKEYQSGCKTTGMAQTDFANAVRQTNPQLATAMVTTKSSVGGMVKYTASLVHAKVATMALKVATMAFNMALTMGISWGISKIIELVDEWHVSAKELAEQVDELTSKFKEQHDQLTKLKGDYDTTDTSSMINRYDKLSKGVDNLGRNISLTSEEYSEYQGIVNKIAEQFPSLVSGYDEQGNALLNVKGNVESLVEAYEKLIHIQNQNILTKAGDIEEDFSNTIKDANGEDWFSKLREWSTNLPSWAKTYWTLSGLGILSPTNIDSIADVFEGNKMTAGTAEKLKELLSADKGKIGDVIASYDQQTLQEIQSALESAGIDVGFMGTNTAKALEETLTNDYTKIKGIVDKFYGDLEGTIAHQKTIATAKLSEAFDVDNAISGLNYGNIGENLQAIAYQVVNSFDYDFLAHLSESGKTVEQWVTEMLDQLNSISKIDNKTIEAAFELQTKFNGGDISYGQYINQLQKTVDFIDKDLNVPDEVKNQIKLSLNSEDLLADYNALVNDLKNIGFDDTSVNKFLNSLSAEEFSAAMKIVPDLDAGATIADIQELIDEQLATEFEFDITGQIEGIEAFNTALSESRSAAGLTSESIAALTSRYEDLEGFNAAALFEKTSNGIHLNNDELSRLEEQYISFNKLDIERNLNQLVTKYNDLTEEIKTCTDAQEKESLQLQANTYRDKIDELSTLASQYDGLTSAFAQWQKALEGAEEGDNYDSLYENLESIKELYKDGLVGTDKFKTAVQLMTNEDLSNAGIDEIVSAYQKGYPKMQRYFTEGQKGCKRFLNDVQNLNSEWAHMNDDGSWEINFDVEGIAEGLGVSTDAVLQISKKLKDYGFEINFEDDSLDNLQTKIEKTETKLKELGQSPVDINVDIEANSENLGTIESEISKAQSKINEINNSAVEPDVKTAQLEDAQAKLEVLIDKKLEINQPSFMTLNTSQVNASLVDALGKVQAYQNAINEVNKLSELKEAGIVIDDTQLQKAKEKADECAKAIQGLDSEVKVAIGLEEDGSVDSIKKAFEEGKVQIDANTDPAISKIEMLADNVERIEDKDVTINVIVNGLEDVKELNNQIDLATNIDGDIDKLSEYVENAKALSKLGSSISSYVYANVKGNVFDKYESEIDNLDVFIDSAQGIKSVQGNITSKITADIEGNVFDKGESTIDNLKVFVDNAKGIKSFAGDPITSKITADIEGSVFDRNETAIDNLKVFIDSANGITKFQGDISSKITADIEGSVFDRHENAIDNLKVFTDSATDIRSLQGNISSKITANIEGNVFDRNETAIDNIKVFTDSAKDIKDFKGDITSKITADIEGSVFDRNETAIDNLKVFTDNAKDIKSVQGDISSKITADIEGSVFDRYESTINNLKVFTDSAKDIKDIKGDISSKITANIEGNVFDRYESTINNLKVFTDSAQDIKSLKGDISSKITADIKGNVFDKYESTINNLKVFTDSAKDIKSLQGDISSKITADIEGNVFDRNESAIDNIKVFIDSAKDIKSLEGDITSKITADVSGNVFDRYESTIDNIRVFIDSVKGIKDVKGDISSKITADVTGNVFDRYESTIDNLKVFTDSAKGIKAIQGDISSKITADIAGNVFDKNESKIDNLDVFIDSAQGIKGIKGDISSKITADVSGNVFESGSDEKLSSLNEFKSIVSGMTNQTVNVSVTATVDSENVNKAIQLLKNVSSSGVFKDYKATVQVGAKIATIDDNAVQTYKAPPKEGKVTYNVDPESSVFDWTAPSKSGVVNYAAEVEALTKAQKHKTGTITYKAKVVGTPVVNGTANVNGSAFAGGTTGKAFKQGDWGVKQTTTALTGELGQELVVYNNRFWTVGDNGAEFTTIPKGAIVFNHKQTEELFANGKVTSNGGRGRILANGTAFIEGTAFEGVTGGGTFYGDSSSSTPKKKKKQTTTKTTTTSSSSSKNSVTGKTYNKSKSSSSSETEDFEETFDWIEIAIERIERAIEKLDQQTNRTYKSWSSRNTALTKEIATVGEEIELQQQSYDAYMDAANAVGLSPDWAAKVRNGEVDIETITDEDLVEKIQDYQNWYNKALDCQDAIEDLKDKEAELYAQRFENTQTQYDGILQGYEHTEAMLNEYINQAEEQGHIVSKEYYQALANNERDSIAQLEKERANLLANREEYYEAMRANGMTDAEIKNSEQWINMSNDIDDVTQSIEEGATALIGYDNAIRDIDWSVFDLIQERISDVNDEADFLIDLIGNKDLYDDNGKLTEQGAATLGLHGQKYNTYMYQSDEYGAEIADIDAKIASGEYDANDQEVINRRQELVELQWESILAAEDEKQAIKDLVSEGIDKELDALSELIDKKNESLEAEKDLYEYNKKVKEQTEEIASLRKQIGAYENDDSEEAKAKLQELRVSLSDAETELKETEWDKYIQDTEQILDTFYTEYETILNTRLDNVDFLLQQVIDGINTAASLSSEQSANLLASLGAEGTLASALGVEGAIASAIVNAMGENGSIKNILNKEVTAVGTTLSSAMNNIWSVGDGNIKSVLTTYGQGFQNKQTTTNTTLNGIKINIDKMVDDVDKDAQKKTTSNKTTTSAKKDPTKDDKSTTKPTTTTTTTTTTATKGDGKAKVGDKVKFVSGKYYYDSEGTKPLGSKNLGKQVYITKINTKSWATHPYHISTGNKLGKGDLGWLKLNQLSGYASGKKKISDNKYAWTQENGQEYIIRPSDGAILTPVAKGDSVLNATASGNIWSMANNPAEFIKDNLKMDASNIPNGANVQNSYIQNFENITFSMPNVHNYDETIKQMQRDPKFEKLILAMTLDQIAGKSSLAKGKSIR